MLNDAKGFSRIIIAYGRTDLRWGIDGLAAIVQEQFQMDPGEKNVLFLFCGTCIRSFSPASRAIIPGQSGP